jgi:alpha-aminoadipic semialdehyde synthase
MRPVIGIRHEDKYKMERRTPLVPSDISVLIKNHKLSFIIEPSAKRIFPSNEFENAGAKIDHDLSKCDVVFGVKEMPEKIFEEGKTYVFFSHVIKGQPYNMPMLRKMMEKKCNLIDYEVITDDDKRRMIFFGKFAGYSGMINSLWSAGQRLKEMGYHSNPFIALKQSHQHNSLEEAKESISEAAALINKTGFPAELAPFTIGFTGYGHVSMGAQEIIRLLPVEEIRPSALVELKAKGNYSTNKIYITVFKEEHLSRLRNNGSQDFDLQHYYKNPHLYENDFEKYIPHLSVLMNCMYWDSNFPRIFTKSYAKELFAKDKPKIIVIGDISCDPDGSIEFTHKGTEIEDPVFVYDPSNDSHKMGFNGNGILVMAVDILPSELPLDSSIGFSRMLRDMVPAIANADFSLPFDELNLHGSIKRALILKNGELTPNYKYLTEFL